MRPADDNVFPANAYDGGERELRLSSSQAELDLIIGEEDEQN